MQVTFQPHETYRDTHPANIKAGDVFHDLDTEGNAIDVLALRNAKRLTSGAYRIIGINLNSHTIKAFRFGPDRTVIIHGSISEITVELPAIVSSREEADPALAERDAAAEAFRSIDNDLDDEYVED